MSRRAHYGARLSWSVWLAAALQFFLGGLGARACGPFDLLGQVLAVAITGLQLGLHGAIGALNGGARLLDAGLGEVLAPAVDLVAHGAYQPVLRGRRREGGPD